MKFINYNIKELFVFFLIAILISIFIHLLSCSEYLETRNNIVNDIANNITNNKNVLSNFNKVLLTFNKKLENFQSNGQHQSINQFSEKQQRIFDNIKNKYDDYINMNMTNFNKTKETDIKIEKMKERVKNVMLIIKQLLENSNNKDIMSNTNGEITMI